MNAAPSARRRRSSAKESAVVVEAQAEQTVVPYDENLLERARTQWQFGDWVSLAGIDRETIQHHPERAKLALLAAAGFLQVGLSSDARQYLRLAQDWGCSKKLIMQILAAGVHNSLARAAALADQQPRAIKHFEMAIHVGTPGSDVRLFAQARAAEQLQQLNSLGYPLSLSGNRSLVQAPTEQAAEQQCPSVSYLARIPLRLDGGAPIQLGLNASKREWLTARQDGVDFHTENGAPLYLVSNEDGNFERAPNRQQVAATPDAAYVFSGVIAHSEECRPVIWLFQYACGKRISSETIQTESGRFQHAFRTLPTTEAIAIGIRVSGSGSLNTEASLLTLKEQAHEELLGYFEKQIEKIEKAQKREVENSMKQIESCIRLQHYLGADIILPDMHNWPISPDFGVLLINLVEQNGYDAVIEFGSGTSTLILAKALERVGQRHNVTPAPLLSFDHLDEYGEKTEKLLKQAGLSQYAKVVVASLAPWSDDNGEYAYYSCDQALQEFKARLPEQPLRILVMVDGPPAATGKHARYPALPKILEVFDDRNAVHFLLDDYLRTEEQEIAVAWLELLKKQELPATRIEFNKLEKKACIIDVMPVVVEGEK